MRGAWGGDKTQAIHRGLESSSAENRFFNKTHWGFLSNLLSLLSYT